MMVLSAIVATAGLLLSPPAVVVGSMVIATIVSTVLTASVGAVRNDRDMFIHSVHIQAIGLGVAILMAAMFSWLIIQSHVVPVALDIAQMELLSHRISPSILAIVIGVSAGAAGAFGLATKGQVTIVGVMIAAALIPTAAAVGIGIAWQNFAIALGSLLLLVVTMIGVNVGGGSMLIYLDYRPDEVDASLLAWDDAAKAASVGVTLLLVVGTAVIAGGLFYQQGSFERTVNHVGTDVLDQESYQSLSVLSVTIEYTADTVSDRTLVTVTLSRTTDRDFGELPETLDRTITERTGRDVTVQVRYVDFVRSDR